MAFRRLASSTTLYELRVPVDEFLNEPWAGDPVDLDALARDPFHAILHLPCMRTPPSADQYLGRCETAHCRACSMEERSESRRGQSIFSPPGASFSQALLRGGCEGEKCRKLTLHRAADDGRRKVEFDQPRLAVGRVRPRNIIFAVPRAQCRVRREKHWSRDWRSIAGRSP